MKKWVGVLSLLSVGILFGLSGSIAKYLAIWLNPYHIVALRFTIALGLALLVLLVVRQSINLKKISKRVLLLYALSFPLSVIFFTLSVFYTKVSLAVFSFYLANLFTSFILGSVLFKERIDGAKIISLSLILVSLFCFTNPLNGFVISNGFIFGLISGVIQTIASVFQKRIGESINRLGLVIIQTFTGVVLSVFMMIISNTFIIPFIPLPGLVAGFIFGLMFLLIAYFSLVGFQKTNLNVGSLLVSTELFFGPLFAFFMFREMLTFSEIVGGIFIILAVLIVNIKGN